MQSSVWTGHVVFCITAGLLLLVSCRERDTRAPEAAGRAEELEGVIIRDGYPLSYRIEGSGIPAMVVGSALYYQRTFSQNLRSHLRLAFLDHRGFVPPPAKASDPEVDFALDKILEDMEAARKQIGFGPIVVIGHSGHSFMALEYAKKYPDRVSHVVMIGIGPDISQASVQSTGENWQNSASAERKALLEESLKRVTEEELSRLSPGEAFIRRYVRDGPRIWYDATFDSSSLWEGMTVNTSMFDYVWGVVFRDIDITRGLEDLDRPVFLALGRYDYLVPPPVAWEPLRKEFQDLTIRVFEKSGHTPQLEEPELFDQELLSWIQGTDGGGP